MIGQSPTQVQNPPPQGIPKAGASFYNGAGTATTQSFAQAGANGISCYAINIPFKLTFSKVSINITTADNGVNISDFGMYNLSGQLLWHAGAGTGKVLGVLSVNLGSSITLEAGIYIFAISSNSNTGAASLNMNQYTAVIKHTYSTATPASGGALVSSITIVDNGIAFTAGSGPFTEPTIYFGP